MGVITNIISATDLDEDMLSIASLLLTDDTVCVVCLNLVESPGGEWEVPENIEKFVFSMGDRCSLILVGIGEDERCNARGILAMKHYLRDKSRHIQTILSVNSSTSKGVDEMESAIVSAMEHLSPTWPLEVPHSYLHLEEEIKYAKQETIAKDQFIFPLADIADLATCCGVDEGHLDLALQFLRSCGHLLYYDEIPDVAVLHPVWLAQIVRRVLQIHPQQALETEEDVSEAESQASHAGVVTLKQLGKILSSNGVPESMYHAMIGLLNAHDLLFLCDKNGKHKIEDISESTKILLPHSLPRSPEKFLQSLQSVSDLLAEMKYPDLYDKYPLMLGSLLRSVILPDSEEGDEPISKGSRLQLLKGKAMEVGRIFVFSTLNLGFFPRILSRLLYSDEIHLRAYWQTGVVFTRGTSNVFLGMDVKRLRMVVHLLGKEPGPDLLALGDNVMSLLGEEGRTVNVQVFVPCTHCMQENSTVESYVRPPYLFTLRECQSAVATGKDFMTCPRGRDSAVTVPVHALVPDLTMASLRGCKIKFEDIKILEEIGMGAFAKVYKAQWRGETVAVKQLNVHSSLGLSQEAKDEKRDEVDESVITVFEEFRREASLISSLQHNNIVDLKGVVMEPFAIVLEYMPMGTLYDFIFDRNESLDFISAISLALDIASGMSFIHMHRLIHRDLKSLNILMSVAVTTSGKSRFVAKVADFGLSRKLLLSTTLNERVVDNPTWLAPEIIKHEKYTEKADCYSFAIIMWEMLTSRKPYSDEMFFWEIQEQVVEGVRPPVDDSADQEYTKIMTESWDGDPEKRPSMETIAKRLLRMWTTRRPLVDYEVRRDESLTSAKLKRLQKISTMSSNRILKELNEDIAEGSTILRARRKSSSQAMRGGIIIHRSTSGNDLENASILAQRPRVGGEWSGATEEGSAGAGGSGTQSPPLSGRVRFGESEEEASKEEEKEKKKKKKQKRKSSKRTSGLSSRPTSPTSGESSPRKEKRKKSSKTNSPSTTSSTLLTPKVSSPKVKTPRSKGSKKKKGSKVKDVFRRGSDSQVPTSTSTLSLEGENKLSLPGESEGKSSGKRSHRRVMSEKVLVKRKKEKHRKSKTPRPERTDGMRKSKRKSRDNVMVDDVSLQLAKSAPAISPGQQSRSDDIDQARVEKTDGMVALPDAALVEDPSACGHDGQEDAETMKEGGEQLAEKRESKQKIDANGEVTDATQRLTQQNGGISLQGESTDHGGSTENGESTEGTERSPRNKKAAEVVGGSKEKVETGPPAKHPLLASASGTLSSDSDSQSPVIKKRESQSGKGKAERQSGVPSENDKGKKPCTSSQPSMLGGSVSETEGAGGSSSKAKGGSLSEAEKDQKRKNEVQLPAEWIGVIPPARSRQSILLPKLVFSIKSAAEDNTPVVKAKETRQSEIHTVKIGQDRSIELKQHWEVFQNPSDDESGGESTARRTSLSSLTNNADIVHPDQVVTRRQSDPATNVGT